MIGLLLLACAGSSPPEASAELVQGERLDLGASLAGRTIGVENPITLPDAEGRYVILEAIRSADWCPVCVGQIRQWQEQTEALEDAGAVLYVLTPDRPEALAAGIEKNQLSATIIPVDKSLWAEWGITNLEKDKLPHPSTFVVDPTGMVVFAETNEDYNLRADPSQVVAAVESLRAGDEVASQSEDAPSEGPKWDGAFQLQTSTVDEGVQLSIEVREGFHVYGKKEEIARPLEVRVDGQPDVDVEIPDGERHEFPLGVVWVVEGTVDLLVPVTPPASGELDLQLCTDTACSPPVTMPWSVQ